MKPELDKKLMMVATRGQTGSDGPVTSTSSTAAPARHNVNVATMSEAGSTGRGGERAGFIDPTASAVSVTQTLQTGTNTRSTQMGSTLRPGLPCLLTDDESGMEPEDPFSQGDRPDPLKTGWERTVGGAVGGSRRLVPPRIVLVEDVECCDGRIMDPSSQRASDESRLYRECAPAKHLLAKLDTYKGENGERLDDFVYQVEEFATFHAWDQVETCRQARTHLRGVALAYIRRAPRLHGRGKN